jgi:predicted DNA-binding transcriptional regulator AlpA
MIWSAVLVQTNGWQRSFQPSMKARMAAVRSRTEVKVPRRMAWRVMMPKKISTRFSQCGWTEQEYQDWLAETLVAALLLR